MKFTPAKKSKIILLEILMLIFIFPATAAIANTQKSTDEIEHQIEQIFHNRNEGILKGDGELIKPIFDTNSKFGTWAYEHELKKMKYIHNWEKKQGIRFTEIKPTIVFRRVKSSGDIVTANLLCSTEYKYVYTDAPEAINSCRIGTYHFIQLTKKEEAWIVMKEWYKDPFEDSLNLEKLKFEDIKKSILSQNERKYENMNPRRIKVVQYLNEYCGAASEERFGYKYNRKYRDYNSTGGDCANFASQALFEGGQFKRNSIWNYDRVGSTRAWVSANGFKQFMVSSGRASVIAYGNYEKIHTASYKLLPGDFVAYEKKGKITHISVVCGSDSRGYSLVSCHNSDRNNVPWDLGWSDKNIKFWLVRVHY